MFRCFVDLLNDESVDVNKCYMEENQSTILQVSTVLPVSTVKQVTLRVSTVLHVIEYSSTS